jgi:thioredoxin-related protein
MFSVFLFSGIKAQQIPDAFYTDIDSAKHAANLHQVPILMVFAGSDWCRPCIQFKEQVLLDEAFQAFADSQLVILYLDFPAKKKNRLSPQQLKHNEALAERFNKKGAFPHIILINDQEEVLATLSYQQQKVDAFIQILNLQAKPFNNGK